jgi:hypothetical protein
MTSAEDIAGDLLIPSLNGKIGAGAVLSVCPYSIPPLALAMTICRLHGWILPYGRGRCRNFQDWIRADRGDKPEQTSLQENSRHLLDALLAEMAEARALQGAGFQPAGNIYKPVYQSTG